jgi:N-acetylglucosaminyl-diphospho-decaprenol L-rhamnosyltransferase
MKQSYVAVVIAFHQPRLVERVLQQLSQQALIPRKVLIVDNGGTLSDDDLTKWQLASRSVLISRPDNPGYGAAVNLAREHVEGDAVLVLTHDAVFNESLAMGLLQALHHPLVGCAAPILYFRDQPDRLFSAGGSLSRSGRAAHLRTPVGAHPYAVDWVDGAIVMYSSEALNDINWLDESFFLYFEDVDTGWRLEQAGWSRVICPDVTAYQQPGMHPPYLGMRNMAIFSKKVGISSLRHLLAVAPRFIVESVGRFRRGLRPRLLLGFRGLYDGYAGHSGKPSENLLKY